MLVRGVATALLALVSSVSVAANSALLGSTTTVRPDLQVADSGSVGGKVGGAAKKPTVTPLATPASKARPAGPAIAGKWRWAAKCSKSGTWTGSISLAGSAGQFSGSMTQDQPGDGGTILGGTLSGNAISFQRRFTSRFFGQKVQTWSGTLSGGAISGQIAYFAEGCSLTMRR